MQLLKKVVKFTGFVAVGSLMILGITMFGFTAIKYILIFTG